MRIAIATDGNSVSQHFGRCTRYTIIDVEDDKVTSRTLIENPGHRPNYLPQFLNDHQVDCIVSGGMGRKARGLFDQYEIETVVGVEGDIDAVINDILNDAIEGGTNLCSPKHTHSGHEHEKCH